MAAEEDHIAKHPLEGPSSHSWLLIGQNGTVEYLTHWPKASASQYMVDHPIPLLYYAELDPADETHGILAM